MSERRVLMLGSDPFAVKPGGLNRYFAGLRDALEKTGVSIDAVEVNTPAAPLVARLVRFGASAARGGRTANLVDAHFALYAIGPLLTSLRRKPLIVHFQGPWADESSLASHGRGRVRVKRLIERAVYRRAARVIVLSDAFGAILHDRYGVPSGRIVRIPPGVDLDRFVCGPEAEARKALDLPARAFVAVATRRLDARMGLDTLLEAWRLVEQEHGEACLLIAGDGPERDQIEAAIRRLDKPERVRLLGRVSDDDLITLYQAADCSVVPSRALEGFGLVVLESLACGTPAIVTDVGGLPEAIAALDGSLVVPADDADALAQRILDVAKGDAPARTACRAHAEQYDWRSAAQRHLAVYDDVLEPIGRRTRVTFVDHCAQRSGAELAMVRLIDALEIDATVVLAEAGPIVADVEQAGAAAVVMPMSEVARNVRRDRLRMRGVPLRAVWETIRYTVRLARYLRATKPDLVHTISLKAAIYGGVAGRLARVPVVWHMHDRIDTDHLPLAAVRAVRLLARLLPSQIIANAAGTLDTLRVPSRKGSVVANPVTLPASVTDRGAGPFTVGIVGRIAPWKGQHVFLEAFAEAFAGSDALARIVGGVLFGEHDYEHSLHELAARLGVADRVHFSGQVDNVQAELDQLDVLVHASVLPEPFGQVIVEGLASGLTVVAANAGGPAEIIDDGVSGVLYETGDVSALAKHLRELGDDPALRARLGAAGRERARDFAPERIVPRVMDVYRAVQRTS